MKRSVIYLLVAVVLIVGVWYFLRPIQYCEVEYSQNPNTRALEVTCNADHCNKTCYLSFRTKGTSDEWSNPNDSHRYDTARWEYRCKCK